MRGANGPASDGLAQGLMLRSVHGRSLPVDHFATVIFQQAHMDDPFPRHVLRMGIRLWRRDMVLKLLFCLLSRGCAKRYQSRNGEDEEMMPELIRRH